MVKKWKKISKLFLIILIAIIYITVNIINIENMNEEKRKANLIELRHLRTKNEFNSTTMSGEFLSNVKTIIGYSLNYQIDQELLGKVDCLEDYIEENIYLTEDTKNETDDYVNWRYDDQLNIYLFSAYYDVRLHPFHYVRVIALLPDDNNTYYCQMKYKLSEGWNLLAIKASLKKIWSETWNRSHVVETKNADEMPLHNVVPFLISCLIPVDERYSTKTPKYVSIERKPCSKSRLNVRVSHQNDKTVLSSSAIDNIKTDHPHDKNIEKVRNSFVICVKPLSYTKSISRQLVEWIEINLSLGAEKILFYVSSLKKTDRNILKFYSSKQLVQIIPFKWPKHRFKSFKGFSDYIWTKRKLEISLYNDCFYRNINSAKFVVPLDIDEVIVPKVGSNWRDVFQYAFKNETGTNYWPKGMDIFASFSVRNVYFFQNYRKYSKLPKENQILNEVEPNAYKLVENDTIGYSIFSQYVRSFNFSPESDSVKSFISVERTLSVFNHYTFHVLGNSIRQYIFSKRIVQLNHYRKKCDPLLIDGCINNFLKYITYDDVLKKFRQTIAPNVEKVLKNFV